jgi:hypothetical protein
MTPLDRLPRVALDESGNTGESLLDSAQPVYVLGSTSLGEDAAAELIYSVGWPTDQELKYVKLRRSGKGRRVVSEIMRQLTPLTAKVAIAHKRFMVMAKLVDNLIEPLAAATNFNLYDDGAQVALAELWHAVMPALIGPQAYEELLSRFIEMSRFPALDTTRRFYDHIRELVEQVSDDRMRDDLELILATREVFGRSNPYQPVRGDLDPAVPSLFATADEWGNILGVPFVIDHDHAKVVEDWLPELAAYLFSATAPQRIGAGWRSFTVPLLVTRVDLVDSSASHAVQVADVISGATREWMEAKAGMGTGSPMDNSLHQLDLMPLVMPHSVWPTGDISPDPTARHTANPADEMAAFAHKMRSQPRD